MANLSFGSIRTHSLLLNPDTHQTATQFVCWRNSHRSTASGYGSVKAWNHPP